LGLLVALFVTKPLTLFLVPGLKPTDPLSLGGVAVVMILTGFVSAWGPVRRAMNVDPNRALRDE